MNRLTWARPLDPVQDGWLPPHPVGVTHTPYYHIIVEARALRWSVIRDHDWSNNPGHPNGGALLSIGSNFLQHGRLPELQATIDKETTWILYLYVYRHDVEKELLRRQLREEQACLGK